MMCRVGRFLPLAALLTGADVIEASVGDDDDFALLHSSLSSVRRGILAAEVQASEISREDAPGSKWKLGSERWTPERKSEMLKSTRARWMQMKAKKNTRLKDLLNTKQDESCVDTDNGAADRDGEVCWQYTIFPEWCGGYDDDDFCSNSMCCACRSAVAADKAAQIQPQVPPQAPQTPPQPLQPPQPPQPPQAPPLPPQPPQPPQPPPPPPPPPQSGGQAIPYGVAPMAPTGVVQQTIWWPANSTQQAVNQPVPPPQQPVSTQLPPVTQAPVTQAPVTQAPVTQAPVTQAPPDEPAAAPRQTTAGCLCRSEWTLSGADLCTTGCCNPDSDAGGEWCAVVDLGCQGANWGYCAAEGEDAAPPSIPDTCVDTNGDAADKDGDVCWQYTVFPMWCDGYDDEDFTSSSMCCACGGGTATFQLEIGEIGGSLPSPEQTSATDISVYHGVSAFVACGDERFEVSAFEVDSGLMQSGSFVCLGDCASQPWTDAMRLIQAQCSPGPFAAGFEADSATFLLQPVAASSSSVSE